MADGLGALNCIEDEHEEDDEDEDEPCARGRPDIVILSPQFVIWRMMH